MATQPPAPPSSAAASGGGGKITAEKRRWRFNPYNRPPPPPPPPPLSPPPKSPTWLSGAAKIITSVFISDSSSSSSSEEYISEGDVDCGNGGDAEDDVDCGNSGDGHLDRANGSNLEADILQQGFTSKELGAGVEETGRKHAIVQLLLQETFSREECDELVKIINSRVLEHSSVDRGKMVNSPLSPGSRILNVTADHAVMEARKFLEEKKAGQSPQIESDAASPADMAKSYMRSRPAWASHSTERFELRTPSSTMLTQLRSAEKVHSVSPLKAKNAFAFGSWSMHDEIRRLRSKATEDMLRPSSSSSSKVETRSSQENGVTMAGYGDKVNVLS